MATSPMDPRVIDAMMPFIYNKFGNPHSITHSQGRDNRDEVEMSRQYVADVINADPKEIIFTSGATESNNLAIKGQVEYLSKSSDKNHIITTVIEHKCVLETLRQLENKGYKVDQLKVNKDGLIDVEEFRSKITDKTIMASIMMVNNELGTIQDMEQIGSICKEKKIAFHSDCAQSFGKIPLDVNKLNLDLVSISGHKIYGPKGIGALQVRKKPKRMRLNAQISGGGQERGFRSGTLAPHQIIGFGTAAKIQLEEQSQDLKHILKLSNRLQEGIEKLGFVHLNGSKDVSKRYAGTLNQSFEFIEGESLLMSLKNVALSSGSACTSESLEPSYVLRALGVREELSHNSIRFSIGRFTTDNEIEMIISLLNMHIPRLRELSPLQEMQLDGESLDSVDWEHPK